MASVLRELPGNRAIVLRNCTCPYCGVALDRENRNKEHVVGRRFVPPGTLYQSWNLILWACVVCNTAKSDLEDEIAAVSLQPSVTGLYARPEAAYIADAQRRAVKAFSRRTRKPVANSQETVKVEASLAPGVRMAVSLRAQAQVDEERIYELARLQVRAFFYFITYDKVALTGRFWRGEFHPLLFSYRGDWGNVVQRAFMTAVVEWEPQFLGGTADGMFKIVIRKHRIEEFFAWAVEWNENVRVIGFVGDINTATVIVETFPKFETSVIPQSDGSQMGFRSEVAVAQEDDRMFVWSGDTT